MTDNFSFLSASVKAFHMNDSLIQVFWTNMNNFKLILVNRELCFQGNVFMEFASLLLKHTYI